MRLIFAAVSGGGEARAQRLPQTTGRAGEDPLTQNILRVYDLRRDDIDSWIADHYDRDLSLLTVVEKAVISAALAEILGHPDTPPQIIINEAVEIAKQYGADGGYQLVNGLLEKIRRGRLTPPPA